MNAAQQHAEPAPGTLCFHCGLPVPGARAPVQETPEGTRWFCCAGCEAVSRFIQGSGLDDFYRLRAASSRRPEADPSLRETLALYDEPAMLGRFTTRSPEGVLEADLIVEGMTCPACAWLVEHALLRVPGIASANVNFATRRAAVRWREGAARASAIFASVLDCGCRAWPFEAG